MQRILHPALRVSAASFVLLLCAAGQARLWAQQPAAASISGVVLDQAGKAIPNAAVAVKNAATGAVRNEKTDAEGRFSAADLPPGTYTVDVTAAGFAASSRPGVQLAADRAEELSISMNVASLSESVTVEGVISLAAQLAPSGNTLDATSAKTEITREFIQNFTSPVSDYSEVLNIAPGTFSVNTNGIGLGQGKIYFRGFGDGQYSMAFDGIPFQDTNDPTHHSWAFFPGQWLGGVDFDRSPGTAATIGPTNFGGSINLLSEPLQSSPDFRASFAYGSFNTRLVDLGVDSGEWGPGKKSSLFVDLHQLLSDGYETYNAQKRVAGSMKYQYKVSDKTYWTAFFGDIDLWTNTPDWGAPSRDQVAQFGDNFLMNNDPTSPYYRGYNYYHVQTDFGYIGFHTDLGDGWKLDNKANTYRYWNKQNLEKNLTTIFLPTSAIDKLNGANHIGDIITLSKDFKWGVFRTGTWYDWSYTDRYQIPSSPLTWVDTPTPKFHEHFITQIFQPYAEFEYRATSKLSIIVGVKDAHYNMDFTQFQDYNTVGCLGGKKKTDPVGGFKYCTPGAPFISHTVGYNAWLPSVNARYRVQRNWSVYAQFGEGSNIPPTSVFDTINGAVETPPNETIAKTYQAGSVLKFNRWTLDLDAYYIHFQNPYSAINDPANQNEPIYVVTGPSNTKGLEAESNIALGHGLSFYLNGTVGSAKYQTGPNYSNGGLWVAYAPSDTEKEGVTWQRQNWNVGLFNMRVGRIYNDNVDTNNNALNQAIKIDPFTLTNVFINYTVRNSSFLRGSKIGFAVNNLFDNHNIVGIAPNLPGTTATPYTQDGGDLLTLLPGRSVMVSLTVGWAPKR
ncbi:MAG TPA: TonB-dependent receptor [Bryobacteraceae bacterium]|nr:TonB-dependent receptor [Bryobacteraceae bacterium]